MKGWLLPCCACRPYFLPCAISAAVNAVALCLNLFVLKETLPALVAAKQQQKQSAPAAVGIAAVRVWVQQLLGRSNVGYERVGSQVKRHNDSSTSSSSCGTGCVGCSLCWELWRAESGLVGGCRQQQQQQVLQPLQPEGSAVSVELAAVTQQSSSGLGFTGDPAGAGAAGTVSTAVGRGGVQLRRADSAIQHSRQPQQAANEGQQSSTAGKMAAAAGNSRQLRPNDSASEYTLQQYKPGSGKHTAFSTKQPQQQEWADCGSRFDQGSDCTILVPSEQQYQQQTNNQAHQQEDGATACSDPLLKKQPGAESSISSSSRRALLPWYKQHQVVLVLLAYGTVCLLFCAIDELTPIFASAPLKQGEA